MRTVYFSLDLNQKRAKKSSIRLVRDRLNKHGVKTSLVVGCYKGNPETTIKAEITSLDQLNLIKAFARMYDQEAILQVLEDGSAIAIDVATDTILNVGRFQEINKHDASNTDSWTFNPMENKFYACI